MYKALVDGQSLSSSTFLNKYDVIETYEEQWPGEDPEILYMSKVRIPDEEVDDFVYKLSTQEIQEGWFTLVWNEDMVILILKDKIFTLQNKNPWIEAELSDVIEYGRGHEIDKKYFLNMRSVMDTW